MNDTKETENEETLEEESPVEESVEQESIEAAEETSEDVEVSPDREEDELEKWRDVAARSQADLDNFRKRMAREKTEAIQYANRSLLESLLPIIDNFEMGLKAARENDGEDSIIFQGMAMVYRQMEDLLSDQGVTPINAEGESFDPNLHEAIKQEPSDSVAEGKILYTVRRGFRLRDRILRAANVVVSSGPEGEK